MSRITFEEAIELHKTKIVYKEKVILDLDENLVKE